MKIKKFYYYSPEKLKLVPIKDIRKKILIGVSVITIVFSSLVLLVGSLFFGNSNNSLAEKEVKVNKDLRKEINKLKSKFVSLNNQFEEIAKESNSLRLSVNLEPLKVSDRNIGIGGSIFQATRTFTPEIEKQKLNGIYSLVKEIESKFNFEINNYTEVKEKFSENKKLYNAIPAIAPVYAPIGDRFGVRFHPILKIRRMHNGLDFLANTGEAVYAPGNGIISYIGKKGGYGKVIKINHGFGYETLYAHLSKFEVKKGQTIKRGDLIAKTGNTGNLSTGPHLHYEVKHNGIRLNPRNFIFEDVKLFEITSQNFMAKN